MSDSPYDMRDRNFREIRQRIKQLEDEAYLLMLQRELSTAASDLIRMPGWKVVCDKIRALGDRQISRLKNEEMEPYWLGRSQGYLRAMDAILSLRTLGPDELALLEHNVTLCTEKIADLRNLLD